MRIVIPDNGWREVTLTIIRPSGPAVSLLRAEVTTGLERAIADWAGVERRIAGRPFEWSLQSGSYNRWDRVWKRMSAPDKKIYTAIARDLLAVRNGGGTTNMLPPHHAHLRTNPW